MSNIKNIFKRERDHNTNWYVASDGTMERGDYLLRNWRGDTAAVLTDGGNIVEYAKYSAYGTAKGIPAGDNDGDVDNADVAIIFGWKKTSTQGVVREHNGLIGFCFARRNIDWLDRTSNLVVFLEARLLATLKAHHWKYEHAQTTHARTGRSAHQSHRRRRRTSHTG